MWEYYKRSSPIDVEGGIKAQAQRGQFSTSWWGKRWITALESFHDSGRLSRGRSYARRGQVLTIDINEGMITSKVQGSRPTPYTVKIDIETLSEQSWLLVIDALSKKAIYTARLLAGELPHDIEDIFREVKVELLPSHHSHLKTDCSCPDWSNPCKHVAAVLYLLGEEFDRDPFLLFKARGMDRAVFLKHLEKKSLKIKPSTTRPPATPLEEEELSFDPGAFWQGESIPSDWLQGGFEPPSQVGVLAKSLGKFPFWHGKENLTDSLELLYLRARDHALELLQPKEK